MTDWIIASAHGDYFLNHHIGSRRITLADQPYNPATGAYDGELWQTVDAGNGRILIKSAHGPFFLDHHIASRRIALADTPYNASSGAMDGELWVSVDVGGGRSQIKSAHGDYWLNHHIASRTITLSDSAYDPVTGANNGQLWVMLPRTVPLPAPLITSFAPTHGQQGTGVVIQGSHLSTTTAVRFNGVSAPFRVSSDSQLTTAVPAAATDGHISITTQGGTARTSTAFDVEPQPLPPNLTFQTSWMEPSSTPTAYTAFAVGFSVYNGGASPTSAFTIRIQLDNSGGYIDIPAPAFAPGDSRIAYWQFPNGLPPGDHFFYCYLDVYNQVPELSENDNISYLGFRVY